MKINCFPVPFLSHIDNFINEVTPVAFTTCVLLLNNIVYDANIIQHRTN